MPLWLGSAGPGFGFWLTGKLGRAWVRCNLGPVHGWCMASVHGAGWVGGGVAYISPKLMGHDSRVIFRGALKASHPIPCSHGMFHTTRF